MTAVQKEFNLTDCDKQALEQFLLALKTVLKQINDFSLFFTEFLEQQKKSAKDLWNSVTAYNILDSGPPCVYPIIQKEELLGEMLMKIQDGTSSIFQSLSIAKEKQENLVALNKDLESKSLTLNWDSFRNPSSKGSVNHRPLSQYLELIADILFQLDVSITFMFQYYDALELHDANSYEHLMHSFVLSTEIVDFIKEFSIKSATLFNC